MRAVLYCRVSTVEQTQNLSLPTQEKACREYAAREGYDVDAVFVDRGESAKTTDRPEFQRMLAACRAAKGKIHAVIVYGLSRFSRNNAHHHAIAALLRGQGIALRSVTEPIDDSPAGRLMEGILASMHQFDNDQKAERSRAGLRAAAERGRWVWGPPIGYRAGAHRAGEPSLVPHATFAEPIRNAFAVLAHTDRGIADVVRDLQVAGVTGRNRRPITPETAHRMLRNPIYTGRLTSPGLALERPGDWVPLVSEDTFYRVQLRLGLDGRADRRDASHPDFPLRGFAYCATCQKPLTAGWSKGRSAKYAYYRCPSNCAGIAAQKAVLEQAFLDFLDRSRPKPSFLAMIREGVWRVWRDESDRLDTQRVSLEGERTRLRTHLRKLEDAFLFDQSIDRDTYSERRQELRERLALTEAALAEATTDAIDVEGILAEAEHAVLHGAVLWRQAGSTDARRLMQRAILPAGILWNGAQCLNRGTAWCCYELAADPQAGSELVDPMRSTLNRLTRWAADWQAARAA